MVGTPPDCRPPSEDITVTNPEETLEDEIGNVRLRKGSSIRWTLAPRAWTKEICTDEVDKQTRQDWKKWEDGHPEWKKWAAKTWWSNNPNRHVSFVENDDPINSTLIYRYPTDDIRFECSRQIRICAEFQKQSELRQCRRSEGCTTEQCCKSEKCRACEKLSKCLPCRNSTKEELGMCDDDNDGIKNSEDPDTPVDRGGLNPISNSTLSLQEHSCSCPVRMVSINILVLVNPSEKGSGDDASTSTMLTVHAGDSELYPEVLKSIRSQEEDYLKYGDQITKPALTNATGFLRIGTPLTGTSGRVLVEFETSSEESSKHFIKFDHLSDAFCPPEWEPKDVPATDDMRGSVKNIANGCLKYDNCEWDHRCEYKPSGPSSHPPAHQPARVPASV